MKKLFFLVLLIASNAFSADSFIVKKDGSKVTIRNNSFRINADEKIIFYKSIEKDSELKMNFKDLDYVIFGVNKFKIFKLENSNEITGYFVIAETGDKTLISISIPDQNDEESSKISYVFHVLDKQNTIIESYEFNNIKNLKNSNLRSEIYSKIKFYFPSCDLLLNRLAYFDRKTNEIDNTAILGFFNMPVYISCL